MNCIRIDLFIVFHPAVYLTYFEYLTILHKSGRAVSLLHHVINIHQRQRGVFYNSLYVCCMGFTSAAPSKPGTLWLFSASMHETSFNKICKEPAGWESDSSRDRTILSPGATQHRSRSNPPGPAQRSALALCLFLQRALDEGQFVWMFNAAAQAGGGLHEMVQWFVAAGSGLE